MGKDGFGNNGKAGSVMKSHGKGTVGGDGHGHLKNPGAFGGKPSATHVMKHGSGHGRS